MPRYRASARRNACSTVRRSEFSSKSCALTRLSVAVRSRTERFFRCGLEFVRHEWRTVQRSELSDADWQRLLAEPHLEIRPADAPDDNEDVPQ